jgi:hypothetical protein
VSNTGRSSGCSAWLAEARSRMMRKRAEIAKREQDAAGTGHSADVQHGDRDSHPFMGKRCCSLAGWRPRSASTGLKFADSGTMRYVSHGPEVASASRPVDDHPLPWYSMCCGALMSRYW